MMTSIRQVSRPPGGTAVQSNPWFPPTVSQFPFSIWIFDASDIYLFKHFKKLFSLFWASIVAACRLSPAAASRGCSPVGEHRFHSIRAQ